MQKSRCPSKTAMPPFSSLPCIRNEDCWEQGATFPQVHWHFQTSGVLLIYGDKHKIWKQTSTAHSNPTLWAPSTATRHQPGAMRVPIALSHEVTEPIQSVPPSWLSLWLSVPVGHGLAPGCIGCLFCRDAFHETIGADRIQPQHFLPLVNVLHGQWIETSCSGCSAP